ncbi:MobP2 family relaxase [Virgibacillus sp. 179-BFC.A HS]|uniref:MobP2 family relaxase n=1 Tax=Tigheibacillus jepli TaxID=3035914 RepID=A0ABU5CLF3_9BACI|nr:MobP2 family relaxase [Virgibacillus sp. 179-BFC.A HS]MDY0407197.1 MobP2 family relaxase [Virgibacillus sp. 179-BFC.A HS]
MSPAVVLRSKFVTPQSSAFNNYINYMDREDAKKHVKINNSSNKENDFDVFYNFIDYMDDDEKQGELFTSSKDELDDKEKQKVKEQFQLAQQNESPMWQDVISFDNEWLAKQSLYNPTTNTVDETKMRSVVRETMHTMLQAEGMQQSAIWTASLHYNTDNIHVHVATVELYPTRERMNVLDKDSNTWHEEYRAKRKPKTLDTMKSQVANKILDRTNERNKIDELLRGTIRYKKENNISLSSFRKTEALFIEAMNRLPDDRIQWRYGYQSINEARPYIDEITEMYLEQFHPEKIHELKTKLDEEVNVMKEMYGEGSDYQKYKETKLGDLKKRMGNAILAEMRAVDKEERMSVFKQKIAMRQLHAFEKENQQNLLQQYSGKGNHNLHVSVIRLKQAMRKTFHDYKRERDMDEFDQMMERY